MIKDQINKIKDYYLLQVILGLLIILAIGFTIISKKNNAKTELSIVVVNQLTNYINQEDFTNKLYDHMGFNKEKQKLIFDTSYMLGDSQEINHSVTDPRLSALIGAGLVDIIICDLNDLKVYHEAGLLSNLDKMYYQNTDYSIDNKKIYYIDNHINREAIGIYINEDSIFYQIAKPYGSTVIAIFENGKNKRNAMKAIEFFVNKEKS